MSVMDFLRGVGHDVKVVGKDVEKPAVIIGEIGLDVVPMVLPEAAPITSIISSALSKGSSALPMSSPVAKAVVSVIHNSIGGTNSMNQLEAFAITMVLGILQTVIKNPQTKATLQTQLIGIADLIFAEYGMVSPPSPVAASTAASVVK